jgi:RND family efflux transporter MFP subunit
MHGLATLASPATARATENNNSYDCIVNPRHVVRVAAPVQGLVVAVEVDRGDLVSAGQVLARMESSVEEANLELARVRAASDAALRAARARHEFLRRKLQRIEQLRARAVAADSALEEAAAEASVAEMNIRTEELNRSLAQHELRRAEAQLRLRTVRSPIAGVVVERSLLPGEYSNENSHILTVAEIDPLHVEVLLPADLYGRVTVGQAAEIRPLLPGHAAWRARVTTTDIVADAGSGTFGVRLAIPNPDRKLPVGVRCSVRFFGEPVANIDPTSPLAVPAQSTARPNTTTRRIGAQ